MTRSKLLSKEVLFKRDMFIAFVHGFSCGLPLLITITLLQAWMKERGIDLTTIGLISLVGIPYTIKFLWAPLLDRFNIWRWERRRGWIIFSQILLIFSISSLSFSDPKSSITWVIIVSLMITLFSATQDIAVDAYRRESFPDKELGLASSLYINGYRIGMLLCSSGGLILADHIPFRMVFTVISMFLIPPFVITVWIAPEPVHLKGKPQTLKEAVIDPLRDYFKRQGAITILVFIVLYKIGDSMASSMTIPFYLEMGYSKTDIGTVAKFFGFGATLLGTLIGGAGVLKWGIYRSLWIFGLLQAISTSGFSLLYWIKKGIIMLAAVIGFENITSGMGTSAFVAYMASITNKRFTATQYALLSSLMGIPRVFASSLTGFLAKEAGWPLFFIICTALAIPGLIILLLIRENMEQT